MTLPVRRIFCPYACQWVVLAELRRTICTNGASLIYRACPGCKKRLTRNIPHAAIVHVVAMLIAAALALIAATITSKENGTRHHERNTGGCTSTTRTKPARRSAPGTTSKQWARRSGKSGIGVKANGAPTMRDKSFVINRKGRSNLQEPHEAKPSAAKELLDQVAILKEGSFYMSGSRGPLTLPNSRRAERAKRKRRREGEPDVAIRIPEKPKWLPLKASGIWDDITNDLASARVPLEAVDASAIAFFVLCVHQAAEAARTGDLVLSARLNKDSIAWATTIGATPMSRLRMGIKPEATAKPNKWAEIG